MAKGRRKAAVSAKEQQLTPDVLSAEEVERLRELSKAFPVSSEEIKNLLELAKGSEPLLRLLKERQTKEEQPTLRSGTKRTNDKGEVSPTSITPDAGLWNALTAWAKKEGVTTTEAINQAIEALLNR